MSEVAKGGRKKVTNRQPSSEPKVTDVVKDENSIIEEARKVLERTQKYDDRFFESIKEQVKYASTPRRVNRFGRIKRRSYIKLNKKLRRTVKRRSIKKKY